MTKQVVIIHGGTTFTTYRDYIKYLETRELSLDRIRPALDWKATIGTDLGKNYDVIAPKMPNNTNAKYKEWKIWFERITHLLGDEVILVGHSLGGVFLAKFLSESNLPAKIKAVFLVAAPFDDSDIEDEDLTEFKLPKSLANISSQASKIYLLHSKDDPVVPFSHLEKYSQALPGAKKVIFKNNGHFRQPTFPEIAKLINSL